MTQIYIKHKQQLFLPYQDYFWVQLDKQAANLPSVQLEMLVHQTAPL
jgi:hypothetical protein